MTRAHRLITADFTQTKPRPTTGRAQTNNGDDNNGTGDDDDDGEPPRRLSTSKPKRSRCPFGSQRCRSCTTERICDDCAPCDDLRHDTSSAHAQANHCVCACELEETDDNEGSDTHNLDDDSDVEIILPPLKQQSTDPNTESRTEHAPGLVDGSTQDPPSYKKTRNRTKDEPRSTPPPLAPITPSSSGGAKTELKPERSSQHASATPPPSRTQPSARRSDRVKALPFDNPRPHHNQSMHLRLSLSLALRRPARCDRIGAIKLRWVTNPTGQITKQFLSHAHLSSAC